MCQKSCHLKETEGDYVYNKGKNYDNWKQTVKIVQRITAKRKTCTNNPVIYNTSSKIPD